ncbi:MAG TPA: aminoacyl-tRNA hydrolase [Phycisphaerae bacterium]|nr:aminoacyl-tRNA hydrolase [Phycisphaerae bacterium]
MDDWPRAPKYVVGLGNPGRRYQLTRHNVGFMVLAVLRERWDFGRARDRFGGRVWTGRIESAPVMLLAPQTYMNESGRAVAEMVTFHKASPSSVLVVLDDMALPLGRLRARSRGSAGGHKGLADIARALGTDEVPRLRVGIGSPPEQMDAVAYVLSRFDEQEQAEMSGAVRRAADAAAAWATAGIECVMNAYNQGDPNGDAPESTKDGND